MKKKWIFTVEVILGGGQTQNYIADSVITDAQKTHWLLANVMTPTNKILPLVIIPRNISIVKKWARKEGEEIGND